ncbi:MAG: hypothetical protein H6806_06695 [Planctomycetes bacterium]|nr:hypothetical protein [Planctomycetota bacterium]
MSVIVDRALPDVRDATSSPASDESSRRRKNDLNLAPTARRSCAKVVSETMELHPHGDQAIYPTLSAWHGNLQHG